MFFFGGGSFTERRMSFSHRFWVAEEKGEDVAGRCQKQCGRPLPCGHLCHIKCQTCTSNHDATDRCEQLCRNLAAKVCCVNDCFIVITHHVGHVLRLKVKRFELYATTVCYGFVLRESASMWTPVWPSLLGSMWWQELRTLPRQTKT